MRSALWFPVSVALVTIAVIVWHRLPAVASTYDSGSPESLVALAEPTKFPVEALDKWEDPLLGISFAYPAGWTPVQPIEAEDDETLLEPGFVIGLESPLEGEDDHFADYVMIEILPGAESGAFESDGSQRRTTIIDGRAGWRDIVLLEAPLADADSLDLVVYQAQFSGLGYTVGLYAVGQGDAAELLAASFEVLLATFRLKHEPYPVS